MSLSDPDGAGTAGGGAAAPKRGPKLVGTDQRGTGQADTPGPVAAKAKAKRGPRRSRTELRDLLLRAGTDLLLQEGLASGAEHLTFKRVLDKLASEGIRITNASIIGRVWDSQADFQTDVLVSVAEDTVAELDTTVQALAEVLKEVDVSTLEHRWEAVRELCRRGGAANLDAMVTSRIWPLWIGAWSVVTSGPRSDSSKQIEQALLRSYDEVTRAHERLYTSLIELCGFRLRQPYTVRQITVAVSALAEGCALRDRVDTDSVRRINRASGPGGSEQEWTLFSVGIEALAHQFLEPDPDWSYEPLSEV